MVYGAFSASNKLYGITFGACGVYLNLRHNITFPSLSRWRMVYGMASFFFLSTQDVSRLHAYVFSLGLLSTRGFKHCPTDPLERSLVLPSGPGYCLKSRVQMSLFGRMRMRAGFRSPEGPNRLKTKIPSGPQSLFALYLPYPADPLTHTRKHGTDLKLRPHLVRTLVS